MGDFHNISIFGENIQSWKSQSQPPPPPRNQEACQTHPHQELHFLGQTSHAEGSGTIRPGNFRNYIEEAVHLRYPNCMPGVATPTNANRSFYTRIVGAMPSSSAGNNNLQLVLDDPQAESPKTCSPLFMPSGYPYSLPRHNSAKSLLSSTVLSSAIAGNEPSSSVVHHSRCLSLPEMLTLGKKKEKEKNHIPCGNFLEQERFESERIPSVTVVVEGRSICQRISLEQHSSYQSFAQALRRMFAESILSLDVTEAFNNKEDCNLSNAIPGYLIAYEDNEGDLLLAGDLSWKEFVRAAKRIRILPAKNPQSRVHNNEL